MSNFCSTTYEAIYPIITKPLGELSKEEIFSLIQYALESNKTTTEEDSYLIRIKKSYESMILPREFIFEPKAFREFEVRKICYQLVERSDRRNNLISIDFKKNKKPV